MDVTTPPSGSKRPRTPTERNEGEVRWTSRKKASTVKSYAEVSDDEDNITVNPGAGALINEVESQGSEEGYGVEACRICGETDEDEDEDDPRDWVQCDKCGVWQHTDCIGLSASEARERDFLCGRCGPYGEAGASMSPAEQPGFAVRSTSMNVTPKAGRSKTAKFDPFSYYTSAKDLSVKRSAKKVGWSPDTKPPAEPRAESEEDDPDIYAPSNEDATDEEDEEYYRNQDDEDEEYYRNEGDEDNESTIFVPPSPSPAPTNASEDSNGVKIIHHPRPKGVTELGQSIVLKWMEGGYRAEIEAENNAVDWGSDVSDIEIRDMSEGTDLLQKLATLDRLTFSMKKKLEKRGARIAGLKQQVEDLERENAMLKGVE